METVWHSIARSCADALKIMPLTHDEKEEIEYGLKRAQDVLFAVWHRMMTENPELAKEGLWPYMDRLREMKESIRSVTINGRRTIFSQAKTNYRELVAAAFNHEEADKEAHSIVWGLDSSSDGRRINISGTVRPGQTLELQDGMIFTIVVCNAA